MSGSLLVDALLRLRGCLRVVSFWDWCCEWLVEPRGHLGFNQGGRAVDHPNSRKRLWVCLVVAVLLIAELI